MADTPNEVPGERQRRPYARPRLETVEVVAEEALLAICSFSSVSSGSLMEGSPCDACLNPS